MNPYSMLPAALFSDLAEFAKRNRYSIAGIAVVSGESGGDHFEQFYTLPALAPHAPTAGMEVCYVDKSMVIPEIQTGEALIQIEEGSLLDDIAELISCSPYEDLTAAIAAGMVIFRKL